MYDFGPFVDFSSIFCKKDLHNNKKISNIAVVSV